MWNIYIYIYSISTVYVLYILLEVMHKKNTLIEIFFGKFGITLSRKLLSWMVQVYGNLVSQYELIVNKRVKE